MFSSRVIRSDKLSLWFIARIVLLPLPWIGDFGPHPQRDLEGNLRHHGGKHIGRTAYLRIGQTVYLLMRTGRDSVAGLTVEPPAQSAMRLSTILAVAKAAYVEARHRFEV